ncbi:ribosomal protein S20 [Novosphingobium chloroacetimidivorans]|uniref:Ribosomal protein S20 n=1 Tax=Novosphingobium chloroacetimidivorans TaxID=1428314 RepID=A0A7W7K6I4_9SPHN|nr:hypothetical protein [Novosphingobium chloroacetimidivorans]MBB4857127.1 ribosomal protein S20 [Novosphingobium chloroacetimidivorans]
MASENKSVPATNTETISTNVVALPTRLEATTASEKAIGFVKEHPVLTVVGGVAVGLAISALIPRSFSRRFAKRAYRYAEAGAAAALSFGQDAVDKAEDGGVVARKKAALLASRAEKLGEHAVARAEKLGVAALGTATSLGHAAAERAERLGHLAAVRAEDLGGRGSDRLSQLGDKALVQSSKLFGVPKRSSSLADRILDKAHGVRARLRG